MDDSFSDFQVKKKCNIGPKSVGKGNSKPKKPLKKSKGQKDIRSLIKKNEIVSYSRDFNEVCKQTGIDVDSEQLQLAIALSKSLDYQSAAGSGSEDVESQNRPLSSQERSAKIKSTLQQYGFKVNNNKVSLSLTTSKRKKYSKNSKLLKISNEERQKNISNKYTRVLAQNSKLLDVDNDCNYLKQEIFYKATNIQYECIKNNDSFYVSNLIEKATHIPNLLRDWSEIPGRPKSPEPLTKDINFDAILCSQHELDEILSSSIDIAQSIVKSKQNSNGSGELEYNRTETEESETLELTQYIQSYNDNECINSNSLHNHGTHSNSVYLIDENTKNTDTEITKFNSDNSESKFNDKTKDNHIEKEVIIIQIDDIDKPKDVCDIINEVNESGNENLHKDTSQLSAQEFHKTKFRSASPDLFDDEGSIWDTSDSRTRSDKNDTFLMDLTENTKEIAINLNNHILDTPVMKPHDIIDITGSGAHNKNNCDISKKQCIDVLDITGVNINTDKDKDEDDVTIITSNDIIEITAPVNENNDNRNKVDEMNSEKNIEMIDLTQVNHFHVCINEQPDIDLGCKNTSLELDDTIIYVSNESFCDELITLKEKTDVDSNKMDASNHSNDRDSIVIGEKTQENRQRIVANDGDVNIDLTQSSGQSEPDCSINPEFADGNCENVNHDTFKNDVTLKYVKDISLDIYMENQSKINDHCEVDNLNSNCDTLSNSNNESLKCKTSSDEVTQEKEVRNDLERLNKNSHTLTTDNDTNISLICEKSVPPHNDTDKRDVDIDLTQASDKSFQEENDVINNIEISSNVEIIQEYEIHNISKDDDHYKDLTLVTDKNDLSFNGQNSNSRLGKVDNISVDYDDMFDEVISQNKVSTKKSDKEVSEANSGKFEISDKELNNCVRHSGNEDIDNLPSVDLSPKNHEKDKNLYILKTPTQVNSEFQIQTPDNHEYIIKTRAVTPMGDYENMTSPERNKELEKYGLKPFKRKRAIQLLTYIYNQTHPLIETCSPEEGPPPKKFKNNKKSPKNKSPILKSTKKCLDFRTETDDKSDIYAATSEVPDIRNVECEPKDWFFPKREKAKVHSCRVPLHIAFHNYVSCRKLLRESILRYEPINIDIIHKDLVSCGYKYSSKDLLKFMDKKCITVKTVDNNKRKRKL